MRTLATKLTAVAVAAALIAGCANQANQTADPSAKRRSKRLAGAVQRP